MIICEFEDGGKGKLRHAVVDVIVINKKKVLLVRRTKSISEGGKWGIVGGFVGRDETVREACQREIFEETGYRISNLNFFRLKDMPDRPREDRQNIAFVFYCQAGKQEGKKDWESDEVKWFDLDSLPPRNEIAFDHFDDIELYKKHLEGEIQIPTL